ncbi:hypothetical protein MOO45_04855 [Bombilactobacillus folatiphilus]|uniref:Uncharacterized protein n=1 Tax=Bombilactobacillus folatiphilus TaxID=2923362 RepID=A0ABY4P7E3_9LACO|nr:hypothetical protein [Bombilactobacillus folatiphilus]UQS81557.1 hypothetical protein MOO45_04855 [Bombilactobacillus folatiphilus]
MVNRRMVWLGGLFSIYMTWIYYSNLNFKNAIYMILFETMGVLFVTILGTCLAILLDSAFVASALIELLIIITTVINNIDWFKKWSFTGLLSPIKILQNNFSSYWLMIYTGLIVTFISIFIIAIRPKNKI